MGTQTWVTITILATEVLIVLKFDWETVSKPLPPMIAKCWIVFFSGLFLWTFWQFYLKNIFFSPREEKEIDKKKE
jgi:phosphatidylserine synthase 2